MRERKKGVPRPAYTYRAATRNRTIHAKTIERHEILKIARKALPKFKTCHECDPYPCHKQEEHRA